MDRIAEAARAPPPRDVAPAFHLPRTSNSSRETLENSSSESSDTDLAGTPPERLEQLHSFLERKKKNTVYFNPFGDNFTTGCQLHPGSKRGLSFRRHSPGLAHALCTDGFISVCLDGATKKKASTETHLHQRLSLSVSAP